METIKRFEKSKYGQGVVGDASARLKSLGEINSRIADCRHMVGRALCRDEVLNVMPWRTGNLGR